MIRRRDKTPCSTPGCPYGEARIKGLCVPCYGWLRRWLRADRTHWKRFVQSLELRQHRITQLHPHADEVVPVKKERHLRLAGGAR